MPNRRALAVTLLLLLPEPLLALAAKGESMVVVADSRSVSGWRAWISNLYNDSHLLFAALTITMIPLIALTMGRLMAWCMGRLGVNLRTRQLAEH